MHVHRSRLSLLALVLTTVFGAIGIVYAGRTPHLSHCFDLEMTESKEQYGC
jgi:hypothetical protein